MNDRKKLAFKAFIDKAIFTSGCFDDDPPKQPKKSTIKKILKKTIKKGVKTKEKCFKDMTFMDMIELEAKHSAMIGHAPGSGSWSSAKTKSKFSTFKEEHEEDEENDDPMADEDNWDKISKEKDGAYLYIKDGNCTTSKPITPGFEELDAALHYLSEGMVKAMLKKSKLRPTVTPLSKKEIKAWAAYKKIMGKDTPSFFQYDSLYDIAQEGCKYVRNKIIKKELQKKEKDIKEENIVNPISSLDLGDLNHI